MEGEWSHMFPVQFQSHRRQRRWGQRASPAPGQEGRQATQRQVSESFRVSREGRRRMREVAAVQE